MPRLIKRKQLDIQLQEPAKEKKYGLSENRLNIRSNDKLELAFDKIATYLDTRSFVELKQIWIQSDRIPDIAQPVVGVIEEIIDLQLNSIDGEPNQFTHPDLFNIIPEFFGDGTSYRYIVKTSNDITIDLRSLHGYLDPTTGILTFLNGNPDNISEFSPPKITCYKYIGNTGEDGNFDGNGSLSPNMLGDWQDSVMDIIQNIPTNPTLGDRYIYNGQNIVETCILIGDEIKLGNVQPDDIITYVQLENSTSGIGMCGDEGWFPYKPNNGTFTSVQSNDNLIYNWSTMNRWKQYRDEKTYPVELNMIPQDTFITSTGLPHIISNNTISDDGTPNTDYNLFLNGIKIQDDLYDFIQTEDLDSIFLSTSNNQIEFIGIDEPTVGDLLEFSSSSGNSQTIIWRTITNVDSSTSGTTDVTYSGDPIQFDDVKLKTYSVVNGNYPITGSYILLKNNIDYDLENGVCPDNITFNYVTPNFD